MKKLSIILFVLILTSLSACNKNKYIYYDGPDFFYLDAAASSKYLSISQDASLTGVNVAQYVVHFSSRERTEPVTVGFKVVASSGLTDGVDYKVVTPNNKLTFYSGLYDLSIRIEFYPHPIANNETLLIELDEVSDSSISLGYPGVDQKSKKLTITKF